MPRPSSVDVEHAALQLCREAEDHMRDHHFTNLRSINTGAESVKSHFSCGAENAKKIHERAVKLLQEKGYLQFKASMGKQVAFCKKGDMEPARAEEFEKTYSKFVEVTKRPGESQEAASKKRKKKEEGLKAGFEAADAGESKRKSKNVKAATDRKKKADASSSESSSSSSSDSESSDAGAGETGEREAGDEAAGQAPEAEPRHPPSLCRWKAAKGNSRPVVPRSQKGPRDPEENVEGVLQALQVIGTVLDKSERVKADA